MAVMVDAVDSTSGIQQGSTGKKNLGARVTFIFLIIIICTQKLSQFLIYVCNPMVQ